MVVEVSRREGSSRAALAQQQQQYQHQQQQRKHGSVQRHSCDSGGHLPLTLSLRVRHARWRSPIAAAVSYHPASDLESALDGRSFRPRAIIADSLRPFKRGEWVVSDLP